ncbi:MAG: GNAT family N-acetyltransferase [Longimicrobiales bacterium]
MTDYPTTALYETERLRLRPVLLSDEESVHALLSDERVVRFTLFPVFTAERARAFVTRLHAEPGSTQAPQIVFAIVDRTTDSVIGLCGLVLNAARDQAELWYLLAPALWGQGLVTEAAGELVDRAFRDLALHRVWASCVPENPASTRVLEKLGFRREGHLRKNLLIQAHWRDSFLYAILADEWLLSEQAAVPIPPESTRPGRVPPN